MKAGNTRRNRCRQQVLVAVLAALIALPVMAQDLDEAARQAARQYRAKILSARTVHKGDRSEHLIKLLTKEGVVKTVRVPDRRKNKMRKKKRR